MSELLAVYGILGIAGIAGNDQRIFPFHALFFFRWTNGNLDLEGGNQAGDYGEKYV